MPDILTCATRHSVRSYLRSGLTLSRIAALDLKAPAFCSLVGAFFDQAKPAAERPALARASCDDLKRDQDWHHCGRSKDKTDHGCNSEHRAAAGLF